MSFEQVWCEQGGKQIRFERIGHGPVLVTILNDDGDVTKATIAPYRWDRLIKAITPQESVSDVSAEPAGKNALE